MLLPLGISFYTFHGISYVVDVDRRVVPACHQPVDFALFIAFVPQLVAGPIGRARIQLRQFQQPRRRLSGEDARSGALLILQGLFKKIAIADAVAPAANLAFSNPGRHGWVPLAVGVYTFALQIYGDFSGYTDIARGSARLLGIELLKNFKQPYLSRNIGEFWRRWHISLSSWLRDYVYIPLGGNRRGGLFTYRNLLLTMVLGGLWHGAAWTFVLWGVLHGAALAVHRRFGRGAATSGPSAVLSALTTFHVVCLGWVLFRAPDLTIARVVVRRIGTLAPGRVDWTRCCSSPSAARRCSPSTCSSADTGATSPSSTCLRSPEVGSTPR